MCSLALHYTVYAWKTELDQMREGLEFAGMIRTNDEASKLLGLFCEKDNPILTASQVKALFPPSFSPDG